jgi:hypothetical protein
VARSHPWCWSGAGSLGYGARVTGRWVAVTVRGWSDGVVEEISWEWWVPL